MCQDKRFCLLCARIIITYPSKSSQYIKKNENVNELKGGELITIIFTTKSLQYINSNETNELKGDESITTILSLKSPQYIKNIDKINKLKDGEFKQKEKLFNIKINKNNKFNIRQKK
eukprot:46861_1